MTLDIKSLQIGMQKQWNGAIAPRWSNLYLDRCNLLFRCSLVVNSEDKSLPLCLSLLPCYVITLADK